MHQTDVADGDEVEASIIAAIAAIIDELNSMMLVTKLRKCPIRPLLRELKVILMEQMGVLNLKLN